MLVDDKHAGQRKQYFEYDGDGNIVDIYTAQAIASGGEVCIRQKLEYATISGHQVLRKQTTAPATWLGTAWDIT